MARGHEDGHGEEKTDARGLRSREIEGVDGDRGRSREIHGDPWRSREIQGDSWRFVEIKGDQGRSRELGFVVPRASARRPAASPREVRSRARRAAVGKGGRGEGNARRGGHLHAGAGGRSRASSITGGNERKIISVREGHPRQSEAITCGNERKIISVREGHQRQSEAITCGNERKIISVPILALPPARIPFTMVRSGALASGTMPSSADAFEK
jgi:hypothetical protein